MPIFIAKTFEGKVESVVLAKSYDLAQAYWQGKKVYAHSVDIRSEKDLEKQPTGVLPILHTKIIKASPFGQNERDILAVSND